MAHIEIWPTINVGAKNSINRLGQQVPPVVMEREVRAQRSNGEERQIRARMGVMFGKVSKKLTGYR